MQTNNKEPEFPGTKEYVNKDVKSRTKTNTYEELWSKELKIVMGRIEHKQSLIMNSLTFVYRKHSNLIVEEVWSKLKNIWWILECRLPKVDYLRKHFLLDTC